jgi:hypothetical protein
MEDYLMINNAEDIHTTILDLTQNVPKALKSYNQWVAWRAVPREGGKIGKIPINPKNGMNASPINREQWGTHIEAFTYFMKHKHEGVSGIGFVFTPDDPFCGVDLDDCWDPVGYKVDTPFLTKVLDDLKSYTEVSPSGKGVKIFMKGKLPGGGRKIGNVEMYDTGRFFTVTGQRIPGYPSLIEDRSTQIVELYNRLVESGKGPKFQPGKVVPLEALQIDALPLPLGTRKLIKEGENVGGRSEAIMSVLDSLVRAGVPDENIVSIFRVYPIGEKYREKGDTRDDWLRKQIEKAREFTKNKPQRVPEEGPKPSLVFPYNVMSGAAGNFAEVYGSILETPKEFLFMSYLTCLGTVLAKKLTLNSEIAPQPRLYTLLLGQSADERKSTALTKTISHFREALQSFDVCWGVGSAEGLQKRLEKAGEGLLLCLDEFKQFVSKCTITSSVLLPCVNTLFESNRYESKTKSVDINLTDAHLSLLAASTVQTYERTWEGSFTDIGFNNRLFLVPGTSEKKHSIPPQVPRDQKVLLINQLVEVLKVVGDHRTLDIVPQARSTYHDWYMGLERSVHSKRLDTYALRLMSLIAVNSNLVEVDEDTVKKAIALCDWQLQVRSMYDPIDADNAIAKMEEKIRRQLRAGPKTERQLKQNTNAQRSGTWFFETARKNLVRVEEIVWDTRSKRWCMREGEV